VPPGDPVALGTAVRRLLDHPAVAAAVAARGRAVAAGWPDDADTVAAAADLYAELAP
ncbi:MAG: glycosyl transferase, partial [Frankiales bacterium]|nr:glycosyl transferase [Frankiales bacterium]